jgi:hypothetical protein
MFHQDQHSYAAALLRPKPRLSDFTGNRLDDFLEPVIILRVFYLAASLLVSRHRSACFITH